MRQRVYYGRALGLNTMQNRQTHRSWSRSLALIEPAPSNRGSGLVCGGAPASQTTIHTMSTEKHAPKRIPVGPFLAGSEKPVKVTLKTQHERVGSSGLCVRAWALIGLGVLLTCGFSLSTPPQESTGSLFTPQPFSLESARTSEPVARLAEERGGGALLVCLGFLYLCGAALFTLAVMKTASESNRRACRVAKDCMRSQGLSAGYSQPQRCDRDVLDQGGSRRFGFAFHPGSHASIQQQEETR
jgi:hypothetical protein